MIASDLKKDIRATIRVSSAVKEELRNQLDMSIQEAFDTFINVNLIFEILPNKGQNNGEISMAKKAVKKEVKNVKEKSGKKKATTKGIRRALWRTASLFVSTVWKGSWNSRKGNILVPNAEVSFLSMTESAASVKKA